MRRWQRARLHETPKNQERRRSGCPNRRLPDRSPARRSLTRGPGAIGSEPMCDLLPHPIAGDFHRSPGTPPLGVVPSGTGPCGFLPDHVPAHTTHCCAHEPFRGAAGHPAFPGLHPAPARFRGNRSQTFDLALVELDQLPSRYEDHAPALVTAKARSVAFGTSVDNGGDEDAATAAGAGFACATCRVPVGRHARWLKLLWRLWPGRAAAGECAEAGMTHRPFAPEGRLAAILPLAHRPCPVAGAALCAGRGDHRLGHGLHRLDRGRHRRAGHPEGSRRPTSSRCNGWPTPIC